MVGSNAVLFLILTFVYKNILRSFLVFNFSSFFNAHVLHCSASRENEFLEEDKEMNCYLAVLCVCVTKLMTAKTLTRIWWKTEQVIMNETSEKI